VAAVVAILAFDGVDDLDFSGVASVLGKAAEAGPEDLAVRFVSAVGAPRHVTAQGLVVPCVARPAAPAAIVFPGGRAAMTLALDSAVKAWVQTSAENGAHLFSVCSGAFLAGQCCRLERLRVAVHGSKRAKLKSRYGAIAATGRVRTGTLTSIAGPQRGGMTKSIALGLEILDRFAPARRRQVARRLELAPTAVSAQYQVSGKQTKEAVNG
jgi:transcriptional regulator GlxA family with amidase domain